LPAIRVIATHLHNALGERGYFQSLGRETGRYNFLLTSQGFVGGMVLSIAESRERASCHLEEGFQSLPLRSFQSPVREPEYGNPQWRGTGLGPRPPFNRLSARKLMATIYFSFNKNIQIDFQSLVCEEAPCNVFHSNRAAD
jgi:hypothetical protein